MKTQPQLAWMASGRHPICIYLLLFAVAGLAQQSQTAPQKPQVAEAAGTQEPIKLLPVPPAPGEQAATSIQETAAEPDPQDSPAGAATATPARSAPQQPAGQALRNENIFVSQVDTEAEKADMQRMGGTYHIVPEPLAEVGYYAAEFGKSSDGLPILGRQNLASTWHGELFDSLQNSVFNARTFFQYGSVKPSRMNNYGFRFGGNLPRWGALSGSATQSKNRGMVNGNALVPLPSERAPLTTDPARRAIISRFLGAYPTEIPNRTDLDQRMLNTNAPQTSDSLNTTLRLDGGVGKRGALSLLHTLSRQDLHAFQIVAGENPDTRIHAQEARATYRYIFSPSTELSLGASYYRTRSDLHAEPNAVGPHVRIARQIESLGPSEQYPLNRAENTFRYGAVGYHQFSGSRHRLTFGGDIYRYQLNGFEQNNSRGSFSFNNNFGRTAIENLLLGTPTSFDIRIGNYNRGFRTWDTDVFFADQWTSHPRLQIYWGLRYASSGAPVEVNRRDEIPYSSDANNLSPRFALVYRAPKDTVIRTSYTVSYGEIFPVTYSQIRYNPPDAVTIQVNNPDLVNPLSGVDITSANPRSSLTLFSPDLATPYSHQYNFSMERHFGPLFLDWGYVGSRTIKLLNFYGQNRAEPVPGIPLTTATVNLRRPDPRYYDVVHIVNGGIGYFDAAQVNWRWRSTRGLILGGNYTFSKALDNGVDYSNTAANGDLNRGSQWQYDSLKDGKGLSSFDSPHSLLLFGSYALPRPPSFLPRTVQALARNWQVGGTLIVKNGTPFGLFAGSDAPGFGNVDGGNGDRPNIIDPSILGATVGNPDTSTQILSRDKFGFMAPGDTRGNLGNNVFRSQGIFNVNATVSREFRFEAQGRAFTLRAQADAYNLGNHAQFASAEHVVGSSSFGKITNTLNNGRVLQFTMRLGF
ncbi:MAG: TonB-dependent receptor [Acidobacteriota bacterium]